MTSSDELGASRALGVVGDAVASGAGVELACDHGRLRVDVLGDAVVRIRVSPSAAWRAAEDWDVLRHPPEPDVDVAVRDDGDRITVIGGSLRVEVERATASVRFVTDAGVEIAADAGDAAVTWDGERIRVRKRRHPDERHSGCGQRTTIDHTTRTKTFWNVNAKRYGVDVDRMYCSVPVLLAHRPSVTYGVYLNALGWSQISAGPEANTWLAEVAGAELDYVIAHGADPAAVVERLTTLLGRIELPPRWAIGYHQSHWGYDSAARVRAVADEFRERRLPCDAFHLDIDYMDTHRVFTWDPERFPDPAALVGDLDRRGIRCVTIVDPGVQSAAGNPVFDAGLELDAFIRDATGEHVTGFVWPGECVLPDFLRPDVRAWWSEMHHTLVDAGVAGIWNDMNEPALYARPVGTDEAAELVEVPPDAPQGPATSRVRHADVHNVYGLSMARAARDALAAQRPDARSFVLTRSGFAGIQRYAAVWTGDNTSSWEHLRLSLPIVCNLGLSGVPFVGVDIGGFWGDGSPELYARWIQAGVLYPMMRGHAHKDSQPNEPWSFGDDVEAVARRALRLRYELRPYLYTLFQGAATTGAPILRPLLWAFSSDPRAAGIEDEVLLGDAVLAAPVIEPDVRRRDVYLPAGRWFDWWTGEAHDGPVDIDVDAPLDRLPMFGRAGTVVPLAAVDDDGRIDDGALTLRVFPGDGEGVIYDDDGETFAYRDGAYALRRYRVTGDGESVTVSLSAVAGDFAPPRRVTFVTPDGTSTNVTVSSGAAEVLLRGVRFGGC